jgi:hypothetical protein
MRPIIRFLDAVIPTCELGLEAVSGSPAVPDRTREKPAGAG